MRKRLLTIIATAVMVVTMIPAMAFADSTSTTPGLEGLYLRYVEKNDEGGIYFNVTNLTPGEIAKIKVELYSGDTLLQTKGIERAASKNGTLGGTFYTVGVSSSWTYTDWTPYDDVVPTHVKVYVNGLYMSTAEVDLTAEEWAKFYGTEKPASEPAPVKKPENSPNTGDNSVLPLAIAGIALAAMAAVVATRRREN